MLNLSISKNKTENFNQLTCKSGRVARVLQVLTLLTVSAAFSPSARSEENKPEQPVPVAGKESGIAQSSGIVNFQSAVRLRCRQFPPLRHYIRTFNKRVRDIPPFKGEIDLSDVDRNERAVQLTRAQFELEGILKTGLDLQYRATFGRPAPDKTLIDLIANGIGTSGNPYAKTFSLGLNAYAFLKDKAINPSNIVREARDHELMKEAPLTDAEINEYQAALSGDNKIGSLLHERTGGVLGVSPKATEAELKEAFPVLAYEAELNVLKSKLKSKESLSPDEVRKLKFFLEYGLPHFHKQLSGSLNTLNKNQQELEKLISDQKKQAEIERAVKNVDAYHAYGNALSDVVSLVNPKAGEITRSLIDIGASIAKFTIQELTPDKLIALSNVVSAA